MRFIIVFLLLFPYTELLKAGSDSVTTGSGNTEIFIDDASDLSFSAEIDLCSSYIFRGIVLKDNRVLQPGINAYYGNLSAGAWANFDVPGSTKPYGLTEVDLYISHDIKLSGLSIKNTAAIYLYTGSENYPTTAEYTFGISYPAGSVEIYTDLAVDFMEYSGAFIVIHGIKYEKKLSRDLYFNSILNFSWAGRKYNEINTGLDKTAFDHLGIELSLIYYPSESFYIKPHFVFNRVLDKEMQDYIGCQSSFMGILTGYVF